MVQQYSFQKRPQYYWIERIYTDIVAKLLPIIAKTSITPNMITILNLFNIVIISYLTLTKSYVAVAILVQVYLFIDILDGNLARYKNMSSEFGAKLDVISDYIFYNFFFVVLGISIEIGIIWLVVYLIIFNSYGLIATHYIVPRIRKISNYRRKGFKKYCFERGIIVGMEGGMQDVITTVLLFTVYKDWIFYSICLLYLIDLLYRLVELKRNEVTI